MSYFHFWSWDSSFLLLKSKMKLELRILFWYHSFDNDTLFSRRYSLYIQHKTQPSYSYIPRAELPGDISAASGEFLGSHRQISQSAVHILAPHPEHPKNNVSLSIRSTLGCSLKKTQHLLPLKIKHSNAISIKSLITNSPLDLRNQTCFPESDGSVKLLFEPKPYARPLLLSSFP